jgi:uncharacterized protein (UPF0276 family)
MENINTAFNNDFQPVPEKSGIGLRSQHYKEILEKRPQVGFLEIHPENYFGSGIEIHILEQLKENYPLSFHAVGLSLGSSQSVSKKHLQKLKDLTDKFCPIHISDHASWSISGNAHLNDLLPLPYNEETLNHLADNISKTQDFLSRQIFLENPSTYLEFKGSMSEAEFLTRAVEKTGCKLLLDINNIFVNSINHNFDPKCYIDLISANIIGEIHLAGHSIVMIEGKEKRIDSHNNYISEEVWELYTYTVAEKGYLPTLIEWDADLPALEKLVSQANKCDQIIKHYLYKDAA